MGKSNPAAVIEKAGGEFAPLPEITAENVNTVKVNYPLYSAAELTAAARLKFGIPPEAAAAALNTAGIAKTTLPEAKRIIEDFLKKEVK